MKKSPGDPIVRRLEELRVEKGMSALEMGRILGFERGYFSRVRNGHVIPGRRFIETAIARFPELSEVLAQSIAERAAALPDHASKKE